MPRRKPKPRFGHAALLVILTLLAAVLLSGPSSRRPEEVLPVIARRVPVRIPEAEALPEAERDAVTCTALAIYHESRGEPAAGRLAVGLVVRNRMRERRLPACQVVFEVGQFAWTTARVAAIVPRERGTWARSLREAHRVLVGRVAPGFPHNHFVNASEVRPRWMRAAAQMQRIGSHTFMRLPPGRDAR